MVGLRKRARTRTIWLFAETLIAEEAVARLFARFDAMLQAEGSQASGGQIIDAAFGEAPRQCTGRDDNEKIKKGGVPAGWSDKKKALRTRALDEEEQRGFYGYKNQIATTS
jgi:IS5 family transposase